MIRFPNLICTATKLKLYDAFILPHFQYCSMIWHFCSARNCEKLESLNKRALRIVFNRRIQNIIVNHYLQMFELYESSPNILKTCLLCISLYTLLRELNYNILSLCKPATTTQGRPGGGGVVVYQYTRKKFAKILKNTQNSSKYTQNYAQVYFIPEIQRK